MSHPAGTVILVDDHRTAALLAEIETGWAEADWAREDRDRRSSRLIRPAATIPGVYPTQEEGRPE